MNLRVPQKQKTYKPIGIWELILQIAVCLSKLFKSEHLKLDSTVQHLDKKAEEVLLRLLRKVSRQFIQLKHQQINFLSQNV